MRARVLVTTRAGGRSAPPYDENNLALHVGDDPDVVAANRQRLAGELGVDRVQFMHQVHGAAVVIADASTDGDVPDADALVTTTRGLAIAVLVADCVPIALVSRRAIAVVHAGRRGLVEGIVPAAVDAIRRYDEGPIAATVGAAICGGCYEVPADMQAEVAGVVPAAKATTATGTPGLDLPAAVRSQLRDAGVDVTNESAPCTREDPRYYSHRRDGVTGRFAMVAMLEP
ncbi:MAG: purine-nucleoside/S-methyl-5-thioadenosine phosphorylase / adenosine deaminase [Frankiaceae bacterium]|nr:purine-nucleoside/S-methyl-5-thioadenosine phosphorylase / adenosine deaminase [Frankiaceae bacterium]